jgi:hypothetical protein
MESIQGGRKPPFQLYVISSICYDSSRGGSTFQIIEYYFKGIRHLTVEGHDSTQVIHIALENENESGVHKIFRIRYMETESVMKLGFVHLNILI